MDFVPAFREQVSRYGEDRFALPCGASALVLAYRRDAFENEANRAAARAAGLELKPPRTWSELDALARFFDGRDWNGDGKPDHGIVLAMGPDSEEGMGDTAFLARAASLGQHRDQYSFLFDSDAFHAADRLAAVRRGTRKGWSRGKRSAHRASRSSMRPPPANRFATAGPPC